MVVGRIRALIPPAALFLGLLLFGGSLLILGTVASEPRSEDLHESSLTIANGTSVLVFPTPVYARLYSRIDVTYAFPDAPGNAYYLTCSDTTRVLAGETATAPLMKFGPLRSGTFVVSSQTVNPYSTYYAPTRYAGDCLPAVVFTWPAVGDDPQANRPTTQAVLTDPRGEDAAVEALVMSAAGSLLVLLGGIAWARHRVPPELPDAAAGTAEALRRSLDRMGAQLERTRRHLLFAGVLGVFLWYPILVPWTWTQTRSATDDALTPWLVAAAALVFLIVLTVLWAREFVRLDREVNAWRARMDELRAREAGLMASLEGG